MSHKEMEAIRALCPLLKEVRFYFHPCYHQPSTSDLLSPVQLRSLLSSPDSCNAAGQKYGIFKNKHFFLIVVCNLHQPYGEFLFSVGQHRHVVCTD